MRLNAVYARLHFWLGSALVALMDAPPLIYLHNNIGDRAAGYPVVAGEITVEDQGKLAIAECLITDLSD